MNQNLMSTRRYLFSVVSLWRPLHHECTTVHLSCQIWPVQGWVYEALLSTDLSEWNWNHLLGTGPLFPGLASSSCPQTCMLCLAIELVSLILEIDFATPATPEDGSIIFAVGTFPNVSFYLPRQIQKRKDACFHFENSLLQIKESSWRKQTKQLPSWPPPFFAKSRYSLLLPPAATRHSLFLWSSIDTVVSKGLQTNMFYKGYKQSLWMGF